jgi:hypothetical protein
MYQGASDLRVVEVHAITSVVAMIPMTPSEGDCCRQFFVVEKPGLDVLVMGEGSEEAIEE